jgi:hypothetical protein
MPNFESLYVGNEINKQLVTFHSEITSIVRLLCMTSMAFCACILFSNMRKAQPEKNCVQHMINI